MVRLLQKTTAQNKKLIPVPQWAIKQTRNNKVSRKFQTTDNRFTFSQASQLD